MIKGAKDICFHLGGITTAVMLKWHYQYEMPLIIDGEGRATKYYVTRKSLDAWVKRRETGGK